jgi:superfamily II DNA or RNA helicase
LIADQLNFDYNDNKWPDQEKFPLNIPDADRKVNSILENDLLSSRDFLLITGFTSLSKVVEVFGTSRFDNLKRIRILIGNDPIVRKRSKYPFSYVDLDVREYWLTKGISLYLGSSVLGLIEKLEQNKIVMRYTKKSHAKIYVGDNHAILGSSNFSKQGLDLQQEANVRVNSEKDEYTDIKKIAENFFFEGDEHNSQFIDLLKQLLSDVTWQEALARGIAEVLEGKWFSAENEFLEKLSPELFWPTQYQGLVEAINILLDKGNVLIADPTGSGKTKMCSAIIISFIYWLWQTGEKIKSNFLLITPPLVKINWEAEFKQFDFYNYRLQSIGVFSHTTEENHRDIVKELKLANLLAVDEAHNLLNPTSNRSRILTNNSADYKILITATPVNKKLEDLIRIIELLDIDNLSDTDFDHYKTLKEGGFKEVKAEDRERLRGFIDNFLVRRTKSELNSAIDKHPERYKNKLNKNCRFPIVKNISYKTGETSNDIKIVKKISEQLKKLKGINYLHKFDPPEYLIRTDDDKKKYIKQRIEGAKNLAIYNVRACIRSSKVALLEYLLGTDYVDMEFQLGTAKEKSGNVIGIITNWRNKPPELKFESGDFEPWLTSIEQYHQACDEEIQTYNEIRELSYQLSTSREDEKIQRILTALNNHGIMIAFDSKLITLDYFNKRLREKSTAAAYVATGANKSVLNKVLNICAGGSKHTNTVIFCSDMMSEGVNLQGASSLILLDLPSVIRLVEQRIGRIDRMDTDHKQIEVLWPNDSDEFSLKGDKRLISTSVFVSSTIGGNFQIPVELRDKHFENVDDVKAMQQELEEWKGERGWEGSNNFFSPIEQLKEKYITDELYDLVKDVNAQVRTQVAFYHSSKSWCFIATRGNTKESPKWIFIEDGLKPISNFINVTKKLDEYLPLIDNDRLKWDQSVLDNFLLQFRGYELLLLPEKRRRALSVAEFILKSKLEKGVKNNETRVLLQDNLDLLNTSIKDEITDFYSLSELWLELLQPLLNVKRNQRINRRKALNLASLKENWKKIELSNKSLQHILTHCHKVESIDYKIAACIIGISKSS